MKEEKKITHWIALKTKPRAEKKVNERLTHLEIFSFLPLIETIRVWSDRKKKLKVPLLPSFVFIESIDLDKINRFKPEGILGVVKYLGKPAIIKNYEIDNLKIMLKENQGVQKIEELDLKNGEKVQISRGVFMGMIGTIIEEQGKHRFIVEINSLDAYFEINIQKSFLEKII